MQFSMVPDFSIVALMALLVGMLVHTCHESQHKLDRHDRRNPAGLTTRPARSSPEMAPRLRTAAVLCGIAALVGAACGGSSNGRGPVTPTTPTVPNTQPPNTAPVIESITVQGSRTGQPPNFADIGEEIAVSAKVRDDETPAEQLQYRWTVTVGSFVGEGASVSWRAPASANTPLEVTFTVQVIEEYGGTQGLQHDVRGMATLSLHDSATEVGAMAHLFLLEFSDSRVRDVNYIMRNFSKAACPDSREIDSEFDDVSNNRAKYNIIDSRIGAAVVTLAFGGRCQFPDPTRRKAGDACAVVRSYWDSVSVGDKTRGAVDGDDYLAAAYSARDSRWWLCSSDYDGRVVSGIARPGFIR